MSGKEGLKECKKRGKKSAIILGVTLQKSKELTRGVFEALYFPDISPIAQIKRIELSKKEIMAACSNKTQSNQWSYTILTRQSGCSDTLGKKMNDDHF